MSGPGTNEDGEGGELVPRNIVAIFHASFHPTKGNIIDWSLTDPSPSSSPIDLTGVEFSVLPSGLHLVPQDVVYFRHASHSGLAIFRRRPTKNRNHRGFRLGSLGVLLEECERPRPWLHLEGLKDLVDVLYGEADRRESEFENGESVGDLLGLGEGAGEGAPGDLRESDFEPVREWFEKRKPVDMPIEKYRPVDVWSGWSDELDGTYASRNTPTHHLPHLLRILGLSSLTLYKFVLSRRRILIYTLPPVEVAGVLAWITADLCREHHMSPRSLASDTLGTPIPSLFSKSTNEGRGREQGPVEAPQSPTVLGMIALTDIPRLEQLSATGKGWIACTTDAIFLEKPQYYDLVLDLTTSTPSRASRPSLYMSKLVSSAAVIPSGAGRKKEKWKLESVRFTWSDVKLWTELDRILKLDSSQTSSHAHIHPSAGGLCCSPKSPTPGSSSNANVWTDAFKLYEDVCLLCATLWMGLGTWRSNSRQSFASRDIDIDTRSPRGGASSGMKWGAARAPGDEDWSMGGTHMRALGMGIEGGSSSPSASSSSPKKKGKESGSAGEAKIRAVGLGIEGRPRKAKTSPLGYGGQSHTRKASGSSVLSTPSMKIPQSTSTHIEAAREEQEVEQNEGEGGENYGYTAEEQEELKRQNIQTTLALLQTFHANTVFWLSKLRELLPPPSSPSTPFTGGGAGYAVGRRGPSKGIRLPSDDDDNAQRGGRVESDENEEDETITITARDLLSLELGVLSELDARFVEWLVEAEGYISPAPVPPISSVRGSGPGVSAIDQRQGRKRRVVVKRGWQELFGILLGLK